jgi:hypothetical protein
MLSQDAAWTAWLKQSDLARRAASAVEIMNNGKLPKDALGFLMMKKPFSTVKNAGKTYLDPKSYARYDAPAAAIDSIDAQAAAKLFKTAKPLLNEACEELGRRGCDFQAGVVTLIKSLLAAPEVDGAIAVRPKVVSWAMTDPKLENLSAPQKILIRMGPKNGPKVQSKLRAFALALGVADAELPKPSTYAPQK